MVRSNTSIFFISKYFFFLMGLSIIVASIDIIQTIMEETGSIPLNELIVPVVLIVIGISLIILNLIYFNSIKIVRLGESEIFVEDNSDEVTYQWTDIEKIDRILFLMPPAFYFRTKSDKRLVIFNSEGFRNFIHFGGLFPLKADMSDMAVIIKKKKKELNI